MHFILRGVRAEYLKIHRTPVYWLLLLCPLALSILIFLLVNEAGEKWIKNGINPWEVLYGFNYKILADLFIILFIAMITSLINNVEHKGVSWKHLYSLAQPRWAVYVNKSIYSLALLFFALAFFSLTHLISGNLLAITRPDLGFQKQPWLFHINLTILIRIFLTTFSIWSIHHWLTFRYRNFSLSIGIGLLMLIFVSITINNIPWVKYLPYGLPQMIFGTKKEANPEIFTWDVWLGIGSGLVIWTGGLWDAWKKDVL